MTTPSGPLVVLCGYDTDNVLRAVTVDEDGAITTVSSTTDAADVTYTPTTPADWDGSTDPGNQDDANDQLAERVKDIEDVLTYSPYPKRARIFVDEWTVLTGNAITKAVDASQFYQLYGYQNASADGDEFTWSFELAAGTYTITILGITASNRGIQEIHGKHSSEGSYSSLATAIDWYAAAPGYNVEKTKTIVLDKDGLWTFKSLVNGKHASSSAHVLSLTKISVKPATD